MMLLHLLLLGCAVVFEKVVARVVLKKVLALVVFQKVVALVA